MTRRQIVPQSALPPQPILADANYTCSPLDTSVTVVAAGLTITLPQNPSPGLTILEFLAGFQFSLVGGAFSPLTPTDPLVVPVGTSGTASFTAQGWEIFGLGTGAGGTVTSVSGTAPITVATGTTTPVVGVTKPVRAYGQNAAPINLVSPVPVIGAFVTFTPTTSGKMTVFVTGVVDNADSTSTARDLIITLSVAGATTPAIFTQGTYTSTGGPAKTEAFAISVPLDLLAAPTTFGIGVASRINVVVATNDSSSQLTIPAGGLQLTVQEALG